MELKLGKKRWILLFTLLIAVSIYGLFIPEPRFLFPGDLDPDDPVDQKIVERLDSCPLNPEDPVDQKIVERLTLGKLDTHDLDPENPDDKEIIERLASDDLASLKLDPTIPEDKEVLSRLSLALLDKADIAWLITATCLVMLMTPGLSFFYGGMVRAKNVISTMIQSVMVMGLISVIWVVVGFSLAFGEDVAGLGLIGNPCTFFMFQNVGASPYGIDGMGLTIPLVLFALFQLKFAIITPALIT
ncbi:MAG: hypothetical protein LBI05_03720, partial [Planctomycetaceae bacterium]|nr:hypothetical protein [Planctomycetaceae bacterium]